MATVLNPLQTDEEQKKQQQGGTILSSGQTAEGGTPGTTASVNPSQRQASSSGRFQNIQNFLKANADNNLAGKVGEKVSDIKGKAEGELGSAKDTLTTEADKTGKAVEAIRGGVTQAATNLQGGGNYNVNQDIFNTGLGQLQAAKDLQYTGPQGLTNEQNLVGQSQQLGSLGKATGSTGGRLALLQRFFNKPTYSQGQQNLDNVLLGAKSSDLNAIRRDATGFGRDLTEAQKAAAGTVQGLQGETEATKQFGLQQAGQLASGSQEDLGNELNAIIAANKAAQARVPTGFTQMASLAGAGPAQTFNLKDLTGDKSFMDQQITFDPNKLQIGSRGGIISGNQANKLGINKFNSGLEGLNTEDPAVRESLLGRANVTQAEQLNQLRDLLGQGALTTGDQLKAGTWSTDPSKRAAFDKAVQTEIGALYNSPAGQDIIKKSLEVGSTTTVPGASYGLRTAGFNQKQILDKIAQQARANVLKKYGVV